MKHEALSFVYDMSNIEDKQQILENYLKLG